jgi:hypothetical protein
VRGLYLEWIVTSSQQQEQSKSMARHTLDDIVFGGGPPPAMPELEPKVRRDSLGRRISQKRLDALNAHKFQPGESGNPGGRLKRRGLQESVISLMKRGKLQPSDTIADLLNLLGDMG